MNYPLSGRKLFFQTVQGRKHLDKYFDSLIKRWIEGDIHMYIDACVIEG